jgi:allantoinase
VGAELLIRRATVADGRQVDLRAVDGVIVEVGGGLEEGPGGQLIDAEGLLALPGAVDPHVHFSEPGARSHWEGWATGSAAAVAGGTTTVAEMPLNASPPTIDVAKFDAKVAAARASSHADFGLWGGVVPGNRGDLVALAERGVLGFKAFMSTTGSDDFPCSDDLTLLEAMETIAPLGLPLLLHAENDAITADLAARACAQGRLTIRDYLDSRPAVAETEAIARALEFAASTGCRVHIVHVTTPRGVELVSEARACGIAASCEVTAHHLALTEEDAISLGAVAKCAPPLRPSEMVDALWRALAADPTLFVVSDHSPSPPELKLGEDAFALWGGIAGLQSTLEVLLTDGPPSGRLPLSEIPRVTATAAARAFGLARKGSLTPGSDADVALVDLRGERILVRDELLDRHRFSPYVGKRLTAQVRMTLLRGEVVYADGHTVGPPHGRLLTPVTV